MYVLFFCVGLMMFVATVAPTILGLGSYGGLGFYVVKILFAFIPLAVMIYSLPLIKWSWRYSILISSDGTLIEKGGSVNRTIRFKKIIGLHRALIINKSMAFIAWMLPAKGGGQILSTYTPSIYGIDINGENQEFVPKLPLPIKKMLLAMKLFIPDLVLDSAFAQDVDIWDQKRLFGKTSTWYTFLTIFLLATFISLAIAIYFSW